MANAGGGDGAGTTTSTSSVLGLASRCGMH